MGRSHPIKVRIKNQVRHIECNEEESLLEAMRRQGIPYYFDCGGRGTCGKCKIRMVDTSLAESPEDGKKLSDQERQEGYRLACRAYPKEELTIELNHYDERIEAVIASKDRTSLRPYPPREGEEYAVAIDLGTTTLALQLIHSQTGGIVASKSMMNPQRRFGSDVISRMMASIDGQREQLQGLILDALLVGMEQLSLEAAVPLEQLHHITIAGNTTMIHLLMGYSCEELGKYPFTPVHIGRIQGEFSEFFGESREGRRIIKERSNRIKAKVTVLPGISAFVGGDIASGLGLCGFEHNERICLFLDLGTNGELAIGNRDRLLVTSTAAGPAFEGGNISIGIGSVPGAIHKLSLKEGKLDLKTIGDQEPMGLCGTGVIELCSLLLENGIMDATGLLQEDYFDKGYPVHQSEHRQLRFLQRDIRELQLAKAAIRAGIELLIRSYGCRYEDIDKVYLAGGFGYVLPIEKAVQIGLLPKELKERVVAIGNSSLAGAIQYAINPDFSVSLDKVILMAEEIHIANQEDFQELYIKHMNFDPLTFES